MEEVSPISEVANDMDEMLAPVMPDTWVGHARMMIHESDLDPDETDFAKRLVGRLAEKYPNQPAEKLARVAIEKSQ